jgi:hypothetical protein
MALSVRVIGVGASCRLAALGTAFTLASSLLGCGESANNSLWDRLVSSPSGSMPARAPEIMPTAQAMAGRWTFTMPGTGACGMTFGPAAAEGSIALDGSCPGKFDGSRSWSIEPTGLFIRDQRGAVLAQLRMTEPGRLEGQTQDGAQVLLGR